MSYFEDNIEPYLCRMPRGTHSDDRMIDRWYAMQEAAEATERYREAAAKCAAEYKRKLKRERERS